MQISVPAQEKTDQVPFRGTFLAKEAFISRGGPAPVRGSERSFDLTTGGCPVLPETNLALGLRFSDRGLSFADKSKFQVLV